MTSANASAAVSISGGGRSAAAHPVAAVRAAQRHDRDLRVPQVRDVAAGRPLRDAEARREPVGRDARARLDELERAQRAGGRVLVAAHAASVPDEDVRNRGYSEARDVTSG